MKRLIIIILVVLFLTSACSPSAVPTIQPPEKAAENTIIIEGFSFHPLELKVKMGTSVTWTNQDSAPHTVTSDSGSELNSGSLSKGQSYSHTFNEAGTFEYHCKFHSMMKAKIIVE
jgi:amicyanin